MKHVSNIKMILEKLGDVAIDIDTDIINSCETYVEYLHSCLDMVADLDDEIPTQIHQFEWPCFVDIMTIAQRNQILRLSPSDFAKAVDGAKRAYDAGSSYEKVLIHIFGDEE